MNTASGGSRGQFDDRGEDTDLNYSKQLEWQDMTEKQERDQRSVPKTLTKPNVSSRHMEHGLIFQTGGVTTFPAVEKAEIRWHSPGNSRGNAALLWISWSQVRPADPSQQTRRSLSMTDSCYHSRTNFDPQLGFNWHPAANQKTRFLPPTFTQ